MVLVAAGQLCSSSNLKENGIRAAQLIRKAVAVNAKILFLPEASDYISSNANHSKCIVKTFEESPFIKEIKNTLIELHNKGKFIHVAVGIHEPAINDLKNRTKNTLIYLDTNGDLLYRYQKIHLFDVDITNGPILKESNSVQPGNEIIKPFKTPAGNLGLGICYDLRFPELALRLRSLGAELLTYPSAWTMKTGPHFQVLGKSIALLTQSYVILPAQSGVHDVYADGYKLDNNLVAGSKRESFGHTCIIDPNGTILAECSDASNQDQICFADIDLDIVNKMRTNMPLWSQRRSDVFGYEV
ncbi:Carbon-nitrogen hydrolase [Pichia californica]|nr:Carbon-nitrogen hydrolase [[Candida] californica]